MTIRYQLRTLFVLLTLAASCCFALRWCLGPVVSPSQLAELKEGMSAQDVERILGEPTKIEAGGDWTYLRLFNPGWFTVMFDANGRVGGYDHEQAFP